MNKANKLHCTMAKVSELRPSKAQPKSRSGCTLAIKRMAADLEEFGQLQPIVIRACGEIILGHTRWLAAKLLGSTEINAIVRDCTRDEARKLFLREARVVRKHNPFQLMESVKQGTPLSEIQSGARRQIENCLDVWSDLGLLIERGFAPSVGGEVKRLHTELSIKYNGQAPSLADTGRWFIEHGRYEDLRQASKRATSIGWLKEDTERFRVAISRNRPVKAL